MPTPGVSFGNFWDSPFGFRLLCQGLRALVDPTLPHASGPMRPRGVESLEHLVEPGAGEELERGTTKTMRQTTNHYYKS